MLAGLRWVFLVAALAATGTAFAHAAPPSRAEDSPLAGVRYRSADHVYLTAGLNRDLSVGERLGVFRGTEKIGAIEVVFVARYSAACRIIAEAVPIEPGDIVMSGESRPSSRIAATKEEPPAPATLPLAEVWAGVAHSAQVNGTPPAGSQGSTTDTSQEDPAYPSWQTRQRLSGSFVVGWEGFGQSDSARGYSRLGFRGNLRLRNIGNTPYTLNIQGSSRRISREAYGVSVPATETRNRLYEISVQYEPRGGRFGFSAGRLGTRPFAADGNLDGVVGEARISPSLAIGGFFGSVPDMQDVAFGFERTKYGAFARLRRESPGTGSHLEVLLAGARESDPAGHRNVAYVETSYRADRRLWLFQRAEVDLGRPTFDGAEGSAALASFSVATFMEVTPRSRLSVTFDRWNRAPRIFDEEAALIWINRFARTGVSASYYFPGPFKTTMSARGGTRWQEGGADPVYFGGFTFFGRAASGLSFGGSLQAFTGSLENGATVSLNVGKRWAGFGLTGSYSRLIPFDTTVESSASQWVRVLGEADLTRRVFIEAGIELSSGPTRDGRRLITGIGYRF